MTSHFLGVDPGHSDGGAALVKGERVLGWWAWTRLERVSGPVYRVRYAVDPGIRDEKIVDSVFGVGDTIVQHCRPYEYHLVLEQLYVGRRRRRRGPRRKDVLKLAEAAGEIRGPLRVRAVGDVLRPLAQADWRSDVLGVPMSFGGKRVEAKAVKYATRLSWVDPLPRSTDALTDTERIAVCEAVCMAVWGQRQQEKGGGK